MKALYERWTAISLPKRILGGMILGVRREVAAEYSFIAAVPIIIGSAGSRTLNPWKSICQRIKGHRAPARIFPCYQFPLSGKAEPRRHHPHRCLPLPVQHTARLCDRGRRK